MEVFDKVKTMLEEYVSDEELTIEESTTLESLKIDSLDMVEIIMSMEEEFSISVDNIADIKTVGELVKTIEESMGK